MPLQTITWELLVRVSTLLGCVVACVPVGYRLCRFTYRGWLAWRGRRRDSGGGVAS